MLQPEGDVRPSQGVSLNDLDAPSELGSGSLQEAPPRGDVEEQRGHLDGRAAGPRRGLDRGDAPAGDPHPVAVAVLGGRGQLDPGDGGDRGERLAPESEGGDPLQVLEAADLARRVAIERQEGVVALHPGSVVGDGDPTLTAAGQLDPDRRPARVEGVLE